MSDAAQLLGLHRSNLYRKMRDAGDGDQSVADFGPRAALSRKNSPAHR